MFKSIFQRLLSTYAAIIMAVIIMLAVLLTVFFNIFIFEQKQAQLLTAGRQMQELAGEFQKHKAEEQELQQTANALGAVTDSRISVRINKRISDLKYLNESSLEDLVSRQEFDDLRRILTGETVVRKKYYSNLLDGYAVFVGLPVYDGDEISGVILLLSPLEQINRTLFNVYKIIWFTAAVSLAAAAMVILIVSRRISRPVENIQQAAAALTEGSFVADLKPEGRDEIAQLTDTFNNMKNRLRQVEEMRKDLIANVSHELRTPLTSVRGFIQAILEGVVGPEKRDKYLQRVYEETGRLNRMVEDLLQLARLQSGSVKLNREQVEVNELVREVAEQQRLPTGSRKVSLQTGMPGEPLVIPADRDKLKQVLINLVDNAVKYSNTGGTVLIRAGEKNGKVEFCVVDDGPGIPADQLPYIFEKFHRVEKSRSRQVPGTGLGLSIARELVELHGGSIYARNAPAGGTEVVFTLLLEEPVNRVPE